jgi:phenylpropionate dioxygenase-like ring-hydroxylating dioxygenase large terminal subunit
MARELESASGDATFERSALDEDARRHERVLSELRRKLTREIVDLAKAGKTDLAPDVMDVDVGFFLDAELFAREHRKLFRETPLVACLSSDIAEPGSYRIFDDVGAPLVVMRGKDGAVRAFLNVCPHRGARVIRDDCGQASRFTCRFHGWTFDTTGKAVGVPEEGQFCGRIDDRKALVPCPAEERHGLVFVQATPNAAMDLDAHLGDFGAELDKLGLDRAMRVLDDEVHVRSNWKYTIDTYFENYHLPSLHRDSFAHVFAHNLCMLETWGPHQRFTFPQRSIHDWMDRPEAEWDVDSLPAQHFIFPNTILTLGSVSPSGSLVTMHRLFPSSVGELTTRIALYAPHGVKSPEHRTEIEASFQSIMRAVRDEDYSVTGEAFEGLAALPAGTKFPVGRQEIGTQNFHRNVERALADPGPISNQIGRI